MSAKVETYAAKIEGPAKFLGFGKQVREVGTDEFRKRFEQARQQQRQAQGEAFDSAAFEKMDNKRLVLDQLVDEALLSMVAERDGLVMTKSAVAERDHEDRRVQRGRSLRPGPVQAGPAEPEHDADAVRGARARRPDPANACRARWRHRSSPAMPSSMLSCASAGRPATSASSRSHRRRCRRPRRPMPSSRPGTTRMRRQYRSPEKVAIEYVEINAATLPVSTVADEASLRERYESVKSRYGAVEQRMASHILVAGRTRRRLPRRTPPPAKAARPGREGTPAGRRLRRVGRGEFRRRRFEGRRRRPGSGREGRVRRRVRQGVPGLAARPGQRPGAPARWLARDRCFAK